MRGRKKGCGPALPLPSAEGTEPGSASSVLSPFTSVSPAPRSTSAHFARLRPLRGVYGESINKGGT